MQQNGRALKRRRSAKSTSTQAKCLQRIFRGFRIYMTYEQLQMNGLPSSASTQQRSRSYRQDSRASPTVLREKVAAIMTSVTSGARLQELSEKFVRDGLSVKIRPVYSQETISGISNEFSETFPRWGILSGGEYGALVTSERRTSERGYLLSETFPTPLASDAIRVRYSVQSLRKVGMRRTQGEYKKAGCNLSEYVAIFHGKDSAPGGNGKLNPTWVEWLMGFPAKWTDCDALGML